MMITSFYVNLVAMSVMWGFEAIVREAQTSYPPLPLPYPSRSPKKPCLKGGLDKV